MPLAPQARSARLAPALLLAAAALSGCKLDLDLPQAKSFTATAARESVAPREAVTLTAAGGQPPYAWTFADGGRLSGDDATLSPSGATATYVAGSSGSAQDVVEVTDASDSAARVRVTVTARLAVTPASTILAPGGVQLFQASGGRGPYRWGLDKPASGAGAALSAAGDGSVASYVAGSTGDVFETIGVSDSVLPVTTVYVQARVTAGLQIFPRTVTAAPNEALSFTAFGGQPPYRYSVGGGGNGAIVPDDAVGLVQIGPTGATTTTVFVVDVNQQVAQAIVEVTPALEAHLSSDDVRGGASIPVVVAGGKAPYAFAFAPRGNRSHGTLDAIGGLYTPGPSPGALDLLQVTDATGTAVTVSAPAVGPLQLATGGGAQRCVAGDFDGNRVADVAFLHRQMKLTETTGIGSASQLTRTYYAGSDFMFPATWAADRNGDGRTDLLMLGRREGGPIVSGTPAALWALVAGADGTLSPTGSPSDAPGMPFSRLVAHLPLPWDDGAFLFPALCTGPAAQAGGISEVELIGLFPDVQSCVSVAVATELAEPQGTRITALAAPDLDGDAAGIPDLVWLMSSGNSEDSFGPAYFRYGAPSAGGAGLEFAAFHDAGTVTSVALPAGTYFQTAGDGDQRRLVPLPPNRGGFPSGLLVRLANLATGRGTLWILAGQPAAWTQVPDLLPAAGSGYDGALLLPTIVEGVHAVVAWSQDGEWASFQILADHTLMQGTGSRHAGNAGFPVTGACAADVTGDGAADLVLTGSSMTTAEVLFGADGVAFGTRPHFRGVSWPAALGDFDGDGIGDVVASEQGLGLAILYGTDLPWDGGHGARDGQLGWGEQISSGPASLVAAAPFVAGGRGDSILYRTTAGGFRLVPNGPAGLEPIQAVPAARPDGTAVPANLIPLMYAAPLGGPDPGPDLMTFEQSNFGQAWAHVLWREGGRIVDLRSDVIGAPADPLFAGHKARDCWFLPVGQESGQTAWGADEVHAGVAVAGLCTFQDPNEGGDDARRLRWVGATIVGSGASLRLSAWTVSAPALGVVGASASVSMLGTIGGRAYFAAWFDTTGGVSPQGLRVVALPPAGATWNPATWGTSVPLTPVTFTPPSTWTPFIGVVGDVDGDGATDAIVNTKEGRTLVLRNAVPDASGGVASFTPWPGTAHGYGGGGGGLPLGLRPTRWTIPPAAGAPGILDRPSLLSFVGDFDNLGVAPEIVPLYNAVNEAIGVPFR